MSCRNNTKEEIRKWVELLRSQNSDSSKTRLRKMWHTDMPSIQSPWTPFTHRDPAQNLFTYPEINLSKTENLEPSATEKLIELFQKQKIENIKLEDNSSK